MTSVTLMPHYVDSTMYVLASPYSAEVVIVRSDGSRSSFDRRGPDVPQILGVVCRDGRERFVVSTVLDKLTRLFNAPDKRCS